MVEKSKLTEQDFIKTVPMDKLVGEFDREYNGDSWKKGEFKSTKDMIIENRTIYLSYLREYHRIVDLKARIKRSLDEQDRIALAEIRSSIKGQGEAFIAIFVFVLIFFILLIL